MWSPLVSSPVELNTGMVIELIDSSPSMLWSWLGLDLIGSAWLGCRRCRDEVSGGLLVEFGAVGLLKWWLGLPVVGWELLVVALWS